MTPHEYDFLRRFLKDRSGLTLSADKQYLVESRLLPVMRKHHVSSFGDLAVQLRLHPGSLLATAVVEAMMTNESYFFRDKTPFELFKASLVPALTVGRAREKNLRIWCAACSTGQEPYSLAMLLKTMNLSGWKIEILATDIGNDVLDKARGGLYTQFEVQRGLPIHELVKHFTQVGDHWQLAADIRAMVTFKQFNLLDDVASLGVFDVIFCRNVLIYFDQATKTSVFNRIIRSVAADGYLVLGAAETVVGLTDAFKPLPEHRGIYVPKLATVEAPPLAPKAPAKATAMPMPRVIIGGKR